ncbi:MAG: DUF3592 domain-containing protein [Planctomycetaceae bacterium]
MAWRFLHWLWATKPPGPDFPVPVCQIILILCMAFGVAYVIGGGRNWWREQYYDAEGVRTDSGVVIAKWRETREGGEGGTITETFLRYRFADQSGRVHQFVTTSQHMRWDELRAGSRLPTIEYLASAPSTHRYASEKGLGRQLFWFGLGLLAAIIPIRLVYGAATWYVRFPECQTVPEE